MQSSLTTAKDTYTLMTVLHHRATGETWLAESQGTKQRCIIKELRIERVESWKNIELFEREATVLQKLDHPHIPSYIDYHCDEEQHATYLIISYVPGRTMEEYILNQIPLSIDDFVELLQQGLDVLSYLHSLKPPVIHRDINPQNLFIRDDKEGRGIQLYLIDFGSVKYSLNPDEVSLTVISDFGYIAPEQSSGHITPGSDMYGLAMSFLALADHRTPAQFHGEFSHRIDQQMFENLPHATAAILEAMSRVKLEERLCDADQAIDILEGKLPLKTIKPMKPIRKRRRLSPAMFVREHYIITGLIVLLFFLFMSWCSTFLKANNEIRTLGGWFTGHPRLISAITGTVFSNNQLITRPNRVKLVTVARDGKTIASVGAKDEIFIWHRDKFFAQGLFNRDRQLKGCTGIAFTPDGTSLVLGCDDTVAVRSLDDWNNEHSLTLPEHRFQSLSACSGKKLFAVFSRGTAFELYDVVGKARMIQKKLSVDKLYKVELSPTCRYIAAAGDTTPGSESNSSSLLIWELDSMEQVCSLPIPDILITGMHFSPDELFLTVDALKSVMLIDIKGQKIMDSFHNADLSAFSPDSRMIAIVENGQFVYDEPIIKVYDFVEERDVAAFEGHGRRVLSMFFNPHGTMLATSGKDQVVKLWHIRN